MIDRDRERFADLVVDLGIVFDREIPPGLTGQYWHELKGFHIDDVDAATRQCKRHCSRFPTIREWITATLSAAASRRQRDQAERRPAGDFAPATWETTARMTLLRVQTALGTRVTRDDATNDELLAKINDELRVLREEYSRPSDCPADRRRSEQRRIVRMLVARLLAQHEHAVDAA